MTRASRIVVVLVICVFVASCAGTPMRRSFKETWNDGAVKSALLVDLARDDQVKSRHVEIEVYRGVVTLHGRAETPAERTRIADIAARRDGVVMVENHIVVRDAKDPRFAVRAPIVDYQDSADFQQRQAKVESTLGAPAVGARSGTYASHSGVATNIQAKDPVVLPAVESTQVAEEAPAVATREEKKPFRRKSFFSRKKDEPIIDPALKVERPSSAPIIIQDSSQATTDLANEAAAELQRLKSTP